MRRIALTCFVFLLLLLYATVQAQSTVSITLTSQPAYPEVGEAFELTLRTSNLGAQRSSITWFVDGSEATQFKNENVLLVEEGSSPRVITARLVTTDGVTYERTYTRNPYRVDIIASANTMVPAFYKGRSMPVSGSEVTLTALVFNDGAAVGSGVSYLWKVNNRVQNGGSLAGKNTITFTPQFEEELFVSVDILSTSGKTLTSEHVRIPVVQSELYFYEKNPLRGLSQVAISDPYIFVSEEVTLRAEPYFASPNIFSENSNSQWEINGKSVTTQELQKNEITLRKEKQMGTVQLMYRLQNMQELLQSMQKALTIQY